MEDLEDSLKAKARLFHSILRENSMNKEDPIPEWKLVVDYEGDGEERCICSTPIVYKYVIENKHTGTRLIIGSECIKRWNIEFLCKDCGSHLGNITRRLAKKDFVCPDCKKREERRKKVKEAADTERRKKLASYVLYWYGPYYKRKFSDVIDDIPYVEFLLNQPTRTKTIEYFEEYVNLCYDVVTVPDEPCLIEDSMT